MSLHIVSCLVLLSAKMPGLQLSLASVAAPIILSVSVSKDAGIAAYKTVQHLSENRPAMQVWKAMPAASFAS